MKFHSSVRFKSIMTMHTQWRYSIIVNMQRINTSSSNGFQPGVAALWGSWTIFLGGVASRYFMCTTVLHLL